MTFATTAAPPQLPPRVAVIGGGVAGLSAAQSLLRNSVAVTVIDMGGRGPGGRVASRQLELPAPLGPASFDHGAQFFTARSPDFRQQVADWQAAGIVQEWRGRHGLLTGKPGAGLWLRLGGPVSGVRLPSGSNQSIEVYA